MREEVKAHRGQIRETPTPDAGHQGVAAFSARFGRDDPSATKSLRDDLGASLHH